MRPPEGEADASDDETLDMLPDAPATLRAGVAPRPVRAADDELGQTLLMPPPADDELATLERVPSVEQEHPLDDASTGVVPRPAVVALAAPPTASPMFTPAPVLAAARPTPARTGWRGLVIAAAIAVVSLAAGGFWVVRAGWYRDVPTEASRAPTIAPARPPAPTPTAAAASAVPVEPAISAAPAPQPSPEDPPGDGSELLSYKGYLIVRSPVDAEVVNQGVAVGRTNRKLEVHCHQRFIRLREPATKRWLTAGIALSIGCQTVTETRIDPEN